MKKCVKLQAALLSRGVRYFLASPKFGANLLSKQDCHNTETVVKKHRTDARGGSFMRAQGREAKRPLFGI